jgi:hypothetical protein
MSGKGDTPRPIPDPESFERNWNEIDWNAREREQQEPPEQGKE